MTLWPGQNSRFISILTDKLFTCRDQLIQLLKIEFMDIEYCSFRKHYLWGKNHIHIIENS